MFSRISRRSSTAGCSMSVSPESSSARADSAVINPPSLTSSLGQMRIKPSGHGLCSTLTVTVSAATTTKSWHQGRLRRSRRFSANGMMSVFHLGFTTCRSARVWKSFLGWCRDSRPRERDNKGRKRWRTTVGTGLPRLSGRLSEISTLVGYCWNSQGYKTREGLQVAHKGL